MKLRMSVTISYNIWIPLNQNYKVYTIHNTHVKNIIMTWDMGYKTIENLWYFLEFLIRKILIKIIPNLKQKYYAIFPRTKS